MTKKQLKSGRAILWPENENEDGFQQVYLNAPKSKNYNVRWLLLWQDESEIGASIVEQAELDILTQTEYRVRDWLLGTIGVGNYVFVNQAEMARKLRIERATASRAIKRLIELKILIQGPKSGRSNTYMISPAFCFSGKLGEGIKKRKEVIKAGKVLQFPQPE